jgi:copper chaperone CopZ
VSVAVKKLDGVQSVKVSLEDGLVAIQLTPGNHLTMAALRKVITSNGFSPKEATVVVEGMITEHTGELTLAVDGTDERFTLASPTVSADIRQGAHVEVGGRLDPAKVREQLTVASVKRLP